MQGENTMLAKKTLIARRAFSPEQGTRRGDKSFDGHRPHTIINKTI